MEKTVKFMKIPWYIDKDPRLQPWMHIHGVNGLAVMWAVERMIARLAEKPKECFTITELTGGLYNKHLPYKVLKEIIVASGFFYYVDGMIRYDWERFAQFPASNGSESENNEDPDSAGNPSEVRLKSAGNPSDTPARDLKATNVDIDVDIDVDKVVVDKEKEKKEKAAARISQLVDEWVIDPNEENMPNREDVRSCHWNRCWTRRSGT